MKLVLYIILSIIIYLIVKKEEKSYVNCRQEKCRNCRMTLSSDFLYCPYCKEQIKRICEYCGKLIDMDWRYCPFCENNEKSIVVMNK